MRRFIIRTFELLCVAMVIVPTALGILFVLSPENKQTEEAIGATVGVFLLTSFLAGGALTLVQIANNTKGSLDALQALRYMRSEWQEGEWRSLFVAAIDSANTAQQLDRWIHLNQSIIERLRNEQPSIYTELQACIADRQNELTRAGAG